MSDSACPVRCPTHDVPCGILLGVKLPGFSSPQSAADHDHNCLPVKDAAGHLILMHRFGAGGDRYARRDPMQGCIVDVPKRAFDGAVKEIRNGRSPAQEQKRENLLKEFRALLRPYVASKGSMRKAWMDEKVREAEAFDLWGLERVVEHWRKRGGK